MYVSLVTVRDFNRKIQKNKHKNILRTPGRVEQRDYNIFLYIRTEQ